MKPSAPECLKPNAPELQSTWLHEVGYTRFVKPGNPASCQLKPVYPASRVLKPDAVLPMTVKAVPPHLHICPTPKPEIFFAICAIFLSVLLVNLVFYKNNENI